MQSGQKIALTSSIIKKQSQPANQIINTKELINSKPTNISEIKLEEEYIQDFQNQFFDSDCEKANNQLDEKEKILGPTKEQKYDKKVNKLNDVMSKLKDSILQLKQKYDDIEIQELFSKKRNLKKEEEAKAFIHSQISRKKSLMTKIKKIKKKQQKRRQAEKQRKENQNHSLQEQKHKQFQKEISQKKTERKQQKQENQNKQKIVKEFLGKINHEKPLFEILELKQKKQKSKEIQFKKAYLNKRKQNFKPFIQNQFQDHFKKHEDKLKQFQKIKAQQKDAKNEEVAEQNLKLLQKIYRGKNYEKIQLEQEVYLKSKVEKKDRYKKLKQYSEYVRSNFKPPIQENQEEDEGQDKVQSSRSQKNSEEDSDNQIISSKVRKIKKYKFLQGKSCGQILELVKMPLSIKQRHKIGVGYLEHVRSLPKKKSVKSMHQNQQIRAVSVTPLSQKFEIPKLPRPKNFRVKLSDEPSRVEISNLLLQLKSKDNTVDLKQKYAKRYSRVEMNGKVDEQQRQINENIIQNIERKLSLLTQLDLKAILS